MPPVLSPSAVERFESCVAHLEPSAFVDDARYCYRCGAPLGVSARVTTSLEVVTDSPRISSCRRRLGLIASVPSVVTLSLGRQVRPCSSHPWARWTLAFLRASHRCVLANIDADFDWHLRVYRPSSIEHRTLRFSGAAPSLLPRSPWRSVLASEAIVTPEWPAISVIAARCEAPERVSLVLPALVVALPEVRIDPRSPSLEATQQRTASTVERALRDALSAAPIDRARNS